MVGAPWTVRRAGSSRSCPPRHPTNDNSISLQHQQRVHGFGHDCLDAEPPVEQRLVRPESTESTAACICAEMGTRGTSAIGCAVRASVTESTLRRSSAVLIENGPSRVEDMVVVQGVVYYSEATALRISAWFSGNCVRYQAVYCDNKPFNTSSGVIPAVACSLRAVYFCFLWARQRVQVRILRVPSLLTNSVSSRSTWQVEQRMACEGVGPLARWWSGLTLCWRK
jgi:hypothetical protein